MPWLASGPVSWWGNLIPVEARNVDRRLRPCMVELLQVLVARTIGIGSHVDQVGHILASKAWLVGSTCDLMKLFHGELEIYFFLLKPYK